MADVYKQSFKQSDTNNIELSIFNCGLERCAPGQTWGPGIRDHYLLSLIHICGSFYLYNWTTSGLFLRREPSGNRIDNLRLVQNTGASGQSAAQLIANEKCSAALDETGEATSLQSISYSDTTWSLLLSLIHI